MDNVIKAYLHSKTMCKTAPVYQYNSGMILQIVGQDLPANYRADFSNNERGTSKAVLGSGDTVSVPYEYFAPGSTIHCWIVLSGADYTVTKLHIMIPVDGRAQPTEEEPEPEQQGIIEQAIATLNAAVEITGQDVTAANEAKEAAQEAQSGAEEAKEAAEDAQTAAETAQSNAEGYATSASGSAQSAAQSALSAEQSKTAAQTAAESVAGAMDTLEATIQADLQAAKESGMFDGKDGKDGKDGADGAPGPKGDKGDTGATGPKGDTGATGPQGVPGQNGTNGKDGFSPIITVTDIAGGHRISITDATGTKNFDVLDGEGGGSVRSIVSIQKTGTAGLVDTYTITYTDSTASTFEVTNGQSGDPGTDGATFTPTVSSDGVISWTNDGGKTNPQPVSIKGPQGEQGIQGVKGDKGDTGSQGPKGDTGATGPKGDPGDDYVLTAADKAEIAQQAAEEVDVPVQDVQVNGTSVVSGGVASVSVPTTASAIGAIAAPASPATGAFLVYDGTAWVAQTLSTWQGGNY